MRNPDEQEFEAFMRRVEPGLRRALFSVLGLDRGREATAEAFAWAWENWSRIQGMDESDGLSLPGGAKPQPQTHDPSHLRER